MRRRIVFVPAIVALAIAGLSSCGQNATPADPGPAADASTEESGPQFAVCAPGQRTTVSGVVYDPAGRNPLYNVIVYVPKNAVGPIPPGLTCDQCGTRPSGDPYVITVTDATGRFVLDNVPIGKDIPLVLQIGKWRRQLVIPHVEPCRDTALTDPEVMRLPRSKAEGDIPLMAIATGAADPFECLLMKIGVAPEELTAPGYDGRVHVYVARGGATTVPPAPPAKDLWMHEATLRKYDLVLLPCESDEFTEDKPLTARQALVAYANAGGRVFTTHYGYTWLADKCSKGECGGTEFGATGQWNVDLFDVRSPLNATVDTSFPKGQAFADWLHNVRATKTKGLITLDEARHDLDAVNPPSQQWMTASADDGTKIVQHMTFNTPLSAPENAQCGRVVFSDFHVSAQQRVGNEIPIHCLKTSAMSAQEKALEYMLFDLSSCIQKDTKPVEPPR